MLNHLFKKIAKELSYTKYWGQLFFLLIVGLNSLSAQNRQLALQLDTGIEIGWWTHNLGSDNANIPNTRGWSRTGLAITTTTQFSVLYQFKNAKIGATLQYSIFQDDDLRGNERRIGNSDRIEISAGDNVYFWKYGFVSEFDIFKNKKTTFLSPHIEFGTFTEDSIHPDKPRFGTKYYYILGLNTVFQLKYFDIHFLVKYDNEVILMADDLYDNERNNIVGVGLNFGLRYWIF